MRRGSSSKIVITNGFKFSNVSNKITTSKLERWRLENMIDEHMNYKLIEHDNVDIYFGSTFQYRTTISDLINFALSNDMFEEMGGE